MTRAGLGARVRRSLAAQTDPRHPVTCITCLTRPVVREGWGRVVLPQLPGLATAPEGDDEIGTTTDDGNI